MRGKTLVVSVAIHVAIAALALFFTARAKERARRPTTVTVVSEKKKEEPKKPPPPPKAVAPPPPAKVAAAPRAVAEPKSAPSAPAPAPIDSGLSFGNDTGPGIAVGPVRPAQQQAQPQKAAEKAQVKRAAPRPADKVAECNEPPSKPEPLVRTHDIEYTARARSDGVEGRLVLRVTVGADGTVIKVEVLSPVEPSLDAAAVATVESWRFNPAMACGRPVGGGTFTIARRFELGD